MKLNSTARSARKGGKSRRQPKSTAGRDDMVSNTSRKDYYVAKTLEMTPHPNQALRSVLAQPVMDRRFKYSVLESTLAASNATSATPLSLISINQGTTDTTRTGDRIRAKRLWFSGKVYGNASASAPITSRILVVAWNQPGAGAVNAPIAGQVIQHGAGYGPFGAYSRDYGDAYQIIYDVVLQTNAIANSAAAETPLIHFDRSLTFDMEFAAGATTPAINNFYLFHVSDSAVNQPTVYFQSTVWFEDLDA